MAYCDDGEEPIVGLVLRETGLNQLARDRNGMVLLKVQTTRDGRENSGRRVHPLISLVGLAFNVDL